MEAPVNFAQVAYNAYRNEMGWRFEDESVAPSFAQLSEKEQEAWSKVEMAVIDAYEDALAKAPPAKPKVMTAGASGTTQTKK